MKKLLRPLLGLLLLISAFAADPLKDAFQRGLLAEESQRDFNAAAAAYAEVVKAGEAQRELLATALFRFAEMQRRLGQTNEAAASYLRLMREYVEQTNLVALAQAQMPGESAPPSEVQPGVQLLEAQVKQASLRLSQAVKDQAEMADFIKKCRALPDVLKVARTLAARSSNTELNRLLSERNQIEVEMAKLGVDFGEANPEILRRKAVRTKLDEQIGEQVEARLREQEVLEAKQRDQVGSLQMNLRVLEVKLAQERQDGGLVVQPGRLPSPAERLLQEEIKLAEEQAAVVQNRRDQKVASQTELLQARRDVLALKRQLAEMNGKTGLFIDPPLTATAPEPAPAPPPEWISVLGAVRRPGMVQLPANRPMDAIEALASSGDVSPSGNRNRINLRRGTNLFRFKFDELMTNRFELKPGDSLEVQEKLF